MCSEQLQLWEDVDSVAKFKGQIKAVNINPNTLSLLRDTHSYREWMGFNRQAPDWIMDHL